MSEEAAYQKLREHLDRLPGGFRATKNDADIQLLKYLFTPEEAELATKLKMKRETAHEIANRLKVSPEKTEKKLNIMAEKGLIISVETEGTLYYQAAPWMVGIWEFQVNRYTDELIQLFNEYNQSRIPPKKSTEKPDMQLRTIPVNQSIDTTQTILPYEQVMELVNSHQKFALTECVCRIHAKKQGRGCDAPMETCILFHDFADFYVRTGRARPVSREEVKEVLEKANKANLVLNPTNAKYASSICCCCGDCCLFLGMLKSYEKPAEVVASSFIVEYDSDACIGCNACIARCQMNAISGDDPIVSVNKDKCIGCGLCVTTCPTNALSLKRKPDEDIGAVAETFMEHWYNKTPEELR